MTYNLPYVGQYTIDEAKNIQRQLAQNVSICKLPSTIRVVAGFDVSYLIDRNILIAGMAALDYPSLNILDSRIITDSIVFPYIPGYLSFREAPALLRLIAEYKKEIDIYVFDGHGLAHPRGLGIASHIGILIEKPSIGCAKKRLIGTYRMPATARGSKSNLMYQGKIVGQVIRTKTNIKPIIVSVGNQANLDQATDLILNCCTKYRIPEPTRQAHLLVSKYKYNYN
jgi:deoxyribonuclease V